MPEENEAVFTPEQILQQAQVNFNYLSLVAIAFLKERSLSLDEFWSFVGERYAPSWGQGMSARDVAKGAALNMSSIGCHLRLLSGDGPTAGAVLGGWPSEDALAFFNLTQEDADRIWGAFKPIAASLGYDCKWQRQGDDVTLTFTRQNAE